MSLAVIHAALGAFAVASLTAGCTHGASTHGASPSAPASSAASAASAAARPAPAGPPAAMARYLRGLTATGRFSGTVLVAGGGRVLLRAGYGLADRSRRIPDGPRTIFQIGSVTKQFTAMAVAILASRGRLRLGGRACAYLPGCPPAWRPITIAELLTHTSGIADWSSWRLSGPLPGESTDPIGAITAQAERVPLAFAPGSSTGYSNPGYVVLGEVIERVSGMSYASFLRTQIFAPVGMTSTGVYQGEPPLPGHALGYLADGTVAPSVLTGYSSAAGAVYSTADDLYRWDQALISGTPRLVPPGLLRQIMSVHARCPYRSCPLAADRGYGYGWFIGGGPAGKLVNHSGSVLGFWAYNGFYPDRDIVVVILANLDTVQIDPISAELNRLATAGA